MREPVTTTSSDDLSLELLELLVDWAKAGALRARPMNTVEHRRTLRRIYEYPLRNVARPVTGVAILKHSYQQKIATKGVGAQKTPHQGLNLAM